MLPCLFFSLILLTHFRKVIKFEKYINSLLSWQPSLHSLHFSAPVWKSICTIFDECIQQFNVSYSVCTHHEKPPLHKFIPVSVHTHYIHTIHRHEVSERILQNLNHFVIFKKFILQINVMLTKIYYTSLINHIPIVILFRQTCMLNNK